MTPDPKPTDGLSAAELAEMARALDHATMDSMWKDLTSLRASHERMRAAAHQAILDLAEREWAEWNGNEFQCLRAETADEISGRLRAALSASQETPK